MKKTMLALICAVLLASCGAKDQCLDKGGSFNEETKQCEMSSESKKDIEVATEDKKEASSTKAEDTDTTTEEKDTETKDSNSGETTKNSDSKAKSFTDLSSEEQTKIKAKVSTLIAKNLAKTPRTKEALEKLITDVFAEVQKNYTNIDFTDYKKEILDNLQGIKNIKK
ncbi:MAG: hypothetical protein KGV43_03040 [Arcobacter sp.]|nr:hypothetical protein [Arcobacter sp.]MBS9782757.1 hypothetical protein [Arcobacter sp.]